ncbi:hypothetical protein [Shewanella indica]|uniref:hypothetical protein n=1 Tax=Shewanella indica TaxID=768528 RepID=UPI0039997CBD
MVKPKYLAVLLSATLLSACGNSDSDDNQPPVTKDISVLGQVSYLGAVAGADVCADLNRNLSCDADEPTTTTDSDGKYQLDWRSDEPTPDYYLLASWIAQTSDNPPAKQQHNKQSVTARTADDGSLMLFALNQHTGAINLVTHLEFSRFQQMLQAGISDAKRDSLLKELRQLYSLLFATEGKTPYQIPAEVTAAPTFAEAFWLLQHIHALTAAQIEKLLGEGNHEAILAAEQTLAMTLNELRHLIAASGQTAATFLATDPQEVRNKVNNAMVVLGYLEPQDDKTMNDNDWVIVLNGLMEDDEQAHLLDLGLSGAPEFFSLQYGDPSKFLIGSVNQGKVLAQDIPLGDEVASECWNTQMERWINAERKDQGYRPSAPVIEGNQLHTFYDGTQVPITMRVDKYQTGDEDWQSLLAGTPAVLQLAKLEWPGQVYRIWTAQQADVMCRNEEFVSWEMPVANAEALDSRALITLFWPIATEDEITLDGEQRFTLNFGDAPESYEWQLIQSPSGAPLLQITELLDNPELADKVLPSEYLIQGGQLIEVDIYRAFDFDAGRQQLRLTYEQSFSEPLYQHLKQLAQAN